MLKPFVKIDHVTVQVEDIERSVKFYKEKLGFELDHGDPNSGSKYCSIKSGGVMLELYGLGKKPAQPPEKGEVGVNHIALKVEDINEAYAELQKRGISFHIPLFFQPNSGRWIAFFRDPDGIVLHITT